MKKVNNIFIYIILTFVFVVALFLRFYKLGSIPAGLHADEASQGFNAYSLFKTGKDMYGKQFPILFRANGSYQPPVYTYLSIVPVNLFGNSALSIRFISALSGTILCLLTFLFLLILFEKHKHKILFSITGATIMSFAPWSIHFSRLAVEANLAVTIFLAGLILLVLSLKNVKYLPVASLLLGISTHAYYSERIIVVILLPIFVLIFRKYFIKHINVVLLSILFFAITLIPHIFILTSGALTRRLTQVSYLGSASPLIAVWEFIKHYFMYFSPSSLFFDSGSNLGRTSPQLSVFYDWMIIPFLAGIRLLFKNRKETYAKIILLILLVTPVPAALTGDLFYPLRTLSFLWTATIVIVLGCVETWKFLRLNIIRVVIASVLIAYSVVSLYISYFVLFKYEEAHNYGYAYVKLIDKLKNYSRYAVWIDSSDRAWGAGIRMAYLTYADPKSIQASLISQLQSPYYSSNVNSNETYILGNVILKPIKWGEVCGKMIIVGDKFSVSQEQVDKHKLNLEFTVNDLTGETELFGYSTKALCKNI